MPKACSLDLRERVIEAVEGGASRREAAERFEVSASSAVKWLQSWRREGRRAPRPRGGSRSPLEDYADGVLALVGEQPDWNSRRVRRGPAQAENAGQPQRAVAFSGASRHQLQKKACARLSSNEPMSPGRAGIGSGSRPCSIHPALSSSMKPG